MLDSALPFLFTGSLASLDVVGLGRHRWSYSVLDDLISGRLEHWRRRRHEIQVALGSVLLLLLAVPWSKRCVHVHGWVMVVVGMRVMPDVWVRVVVSGSGKHFERTSSRSCDIWRLKKTPKSTLFFLYNAYYSQNHVKCSRPLCSLPGLRGQKFFADAIINFLIPFKSISDKNSYDQLFINEVVKIFTFQFGESITKFYVVKNIWILMTFFEDVVKYHKIFLRGTRKKFTSIKFSGGRKNWKMAIFGLHYIKVSSFFMSMQWTYNFFMNSQI